MEDVGIFMASCLCYGQMVYIFLFGTKCGHLVYFSRFGMLYREKSGNPDVDHVEAE
jgi:hypothetical protein